MPPPLPSLRIDNPPMELLRTSTYLGIQQAAKLENVTLSPNLVPQLAEAVVVAHISVLSTHTLAHLLQAVLNAAIGFQANAKRRRQHGTTCVDPAWPPHVSPRSGMPHNGTILWQ